MRGILIALIVVSLAGCSWFRRDGEGVAAAVLPYKASLSKGEDNRDVSISVRAGDASVEDVRESVRFPATRYCLSVFGGSEVDWSLDPVTADWAYVRDGEDMVFTGRCTSRG